MFTSNLFILKEEFQFCYHFYQLSYKCVFIANFWMKTQNITIEHNKSISINYASFQGIGLETRHPYLLMVQYIFVLALFYLERYVMGSCTHHYLGMNIILDHKNEILIDLHLNIQKDLLFMSLLSQKKNKQLIKTLLFISLRACGKDHGRQSSCWLTQPLSFRTYWNL